VPTALANDLCPVSGNCGHALWRRGEGILCGAARGDDGGGGRQDAGAEIGLAQELPEGLDGAQPGKRRRRLAQTDSAWDTRLFARLGPSGSIEEQVFDKLGRRDCLASPGR
jgi:hypothetical protein